jgi:hypothetical protein
VKTQLTLTLGEPIKRKTLASKLRVEVLLRRKNWPTLKDNKQLQNKGI